MKRFVIAAVMALALPFAALAAVQEFEEFTLDIPSGWTATQEGPTVIVVADDKSASGSITLAPTEGHSLEELAAAFSQQFGGTEPQEDEEGDIFFTFNEENSVAMLTMADDSRYLLYVRTGDSEAMDAIMRSIQEK